MADQRISQLAQVVTLATNDLIPLVDISDPTQSPQGTTKYMEAFQIGDVLTEEGFVKGDVYTEILSTGIITGGALSINADNTKFDVAAGSGYIVDHTVSPPTVTLVSWGAFSAQTVTNLATQFATDIGIDINGNIVQQTSYTDQQLRESIIQLGGLDHSNQTNILSTFAIQVPVQAVGSSLRELSFAVGDINISGNTYAPNGANLSINKSAGEVFSFGRNHVNDEQNPHKITTASDTLVSFGYVFNNGSGSGTFTTPVTTIDPDQWDNGTGTLASVPVNDWTIQRILFFPNDNKTFVQYGTETFNQLQDAEIGINSTVFQPLAGIRTAMVRGYLLVQQGETNLQSANTKFVPANRFGIVVGAGGGSGAVWGGISGTLSDQTDLQTELDGKSDVGHTHLIADITDFTDNSANWDAAYNDKINSAAFNTGTGDLTLTQQDLGTVIVNLDGRYLTTETDNQTLTWTDATNTLDISGGNSVVLTGFADATHTHLIADITDFTDNSTNWDTAYNDKINSASFDTGTGILTLTQQDLGTVTVDLDGRYVQSVTAGTGLAIGGGALSPQVQLDFSALVDMTVGMVGTDEFVVLDAGLERRKAANEIGLSIFNNDAGFVTADTNNYVDSLSFATGTGVLTATRIGLGDLTVDLDGRYLEAVPSTITIEAVVWDDPLSTETMTAVFAGQDFTFNPSGAGNPNLTYDFDTDTWLIGGNEIATTANSINGSISDNQIAVGATTANTIEGSASLTFDGTFLTTSGRIRTTGNEVDIEGASPRIDFTETAGTNNWNILVDADNFDVRENGTADTRFRINDGGRVHLSGTGGEKLRLIGPSTGNANTSYLTFYESNGTVRQGYVGFGSGTDSTMYFYSDAGTDNYLALYDTGNASIFSGAVNRFTVTSAGYAQVKGARLYLGSSDNQALRGEDTWLRLNDAGDFTSGVYTPGAFRTDGGIDVGSSTQNDWTTTRARLYVSSLDGLRLQPSTASSDGFYMRAYDNAGTQQWYFGRPSTTSSYVQLYSYRGTNYFRLDDDGDIHMGGGNVYSTNNIEAPNFVLSSDARIKSDIQDLVPTPTKIKWRTFMLDGKQRYGVVAQEVQKVNPDWVNIGNDGKLGVTYIDLLVHKVAELEHQIENLKKRL